MRFLAHPETEDFIPQIKITLGGGGPLQPAWNEKGLKTRVVFRNSFHSMTQGLNLVVR